MIKFIIKAGLIWAIASALYLHCYEKDQFRLFKKESKNQQEVLPRVVALTFDDGPDAAVTPAVLDVLKKYGIKATFFFVGEEAEKHKGVFLRAHAEGHAIFSHTFDHKKLTNLKPNEIQNELTTTQQILESLIGKELPLLFRPPFGAVNPLVVTTYKALGYKAIFWSLDTRDWESKNKDAIIATVIDKVEPGDIILMHSRKGTEATPEALPTIIEWLQSEGYSFVRIGD